MINHRCRHYRAARPCVFNKQEGAECPTCRHRDEVGERVLFIKLDAIGDVLRSASLLPEIARRHARPYVAWLTRPESVELVGLMRHVDEVIELSETGLARLAAGGWDHVYSLSNDLASASLATLAAARHSTVGFHMRDGQLVATNEAAETWLRMAAFDRLKRQNARSYQELMMAIIGAPGAAVPPPALSIRESDRQAAARRIAELLPGPRRTRVAVNVGSGARWPKKMLGVEQTVRFATALRARSGADLLLVGGAAEAEKTAAILAGCGPDPRIRAALTGGSIAAFAATLMQVDALLCGDTLAVHVASAIGLPTVALFGPTSAAEIHEYDGLIAKTWAAGLDCLACYGDCDKPQTCMTLLDPDRLVELTLRQMARTRADLPKRAARPGARVAARSEAGRRPADRLRLTR